MEQQQHTVLITGLPAEGTTEQEVRQYIRFCGEVDAIYLFTAHQRAGTTPRSLPASSAALVYFHHRSSVAYAELLSGSLYQGKMIEIHRSTADQAQQELFTTTADEPVRDDGAASAAAALSTDASTSAPVTAAAAIEDIPETMTGLWVRARMQWAVRAMQSRADGLVFGAREKMARARQEVLSLEMKAVHAVRDVYELREWVPVFGNGPTVEQYDYTPTQPQWGEKPAWVRAPPKK